MNSRPNVFLLKSLPILEIDAEVTILIPDGYGRPVAREVPFDADDLRAAGAAGHVGDVRKGEIGSDVLLDGEPE